MGSNPTLSAIKTFPMKPLFFRSTVPISKKVVKGRKKDLRAIAAKRDEDIDFSDAAPVLDWSGAEIGKFYRPKKSVTA